MIVVGVICGQIVLVPAFFKLLVGELKNRTLALVLNNPLKFRIETSHIKLFAFCLLPSLGAHHVLLARVKNDVMEAFHLPFEG